MCKSSQKKFQLESNCAYLLCNGQGGDWWDAWRQIGGFHRFERCSQNLRILNSPFFLGRINFFNFQADHEEILPTDGFSIPTSWEHSCVAGVGGRRGFDRAMETSTHAVVLLPEKYCSCAYQAFGASEWSICVGWIFLLSLIPERNRSARGSPMNSSRRRAMDSGEKLYPVRARWWSKDWRCCPCPICADIACSLCKRWNSLICSPEFGMWCNPERRPKGVIKGECFVVKLRLCIDYAKSGARCKKISSWSIFDLDTRRWYINVEDTLPKGVDFHVAAMDAGLVCTFRTALTDEQRRASTILSSITTERQILVVPNLIGKSMHASTAKYIQLCMSVLTEPIWNW